MNKARLDWVMSGLNQYTLTASEVLFLKTVTAEFEKNQVLTAPQEARLENLYKEKSKLTPNKKANELSVSQNSTKKTRPRMPRPKIY
jgi:hypothetical protein